MNVLPLEPCQTLVAQMMENVHHAILATLDQNVTNVLRATLKDQMEVVKNVVVQVLDPSTQPAMPWDNAIARTH